MKPIVRSALFCLALALLLPFTALAADAENADAAPVVASQDGDAVAPVAATPADPKADQLSTWLDAPEWTTEKANTSFGSCPGPPAISCQCGPDLGEPGSQACCYCNTCWQGYILALCGLDP